MEVPAAFREFAEKGIAQAKENYEKMKSVAEEATDTLEDTYSTAAKGCSGYGLKVIESARANSNAAFDLIGRIDVGEVLFRGGRAFDRLHARAVRHRIAQAKDLAEMRAESRDRYRGADQGGFLLGHEQGRLI